MIFALVLALFALIGVPLFALIGAATLSFYLDMPEGSWASGAIDAIGGNFSDSPSLMTVPLLAFTACMLAEAGPARRLSAVRDAGLGWLPNPNAAAGVVNSGTFGPQLPPLMPLILYACASYLVLDRAMFAGIVPGALLIGGSAIAGMLGGRGLPRERFSWRLAWRALWIARWELVLPAALIAVLGLGLLHLQEAAALAALNVLVVEVFVQRDLRLRSDLPRIATQAITWTGVLLLLFAMALAFVGWARQTPLVTGLLAWLSERDASQLAFLLLVCGLVLLASALLDVYTALLVVAPLLSSAADHYGVDPYQLAIVVLLAAALGRLTPQLRTRLPWAVVLTAVLVIAIRVPLVSMALAYRLGTPAD